MALVPPKGENFKSTFLYNDSFKANYILNKPTTAIPFSLCASAIARVDADC